jgi:hypothetical protein
MADDVLVGRRRSNVRAPSRLLAAALGLAVALSLFQTVRPEEAAGARVLYVAPGAGGDCSSTRPCGSIDAAFAKVVAGDHIQLAAGTYPRQVIASNRPNSASFSQNVVVRPAPGARVVVKGIEVQVAHLTLRDLHVEGDRVTTVAYLSPHYFRVERLKLRNSSINLNNTDNSAVIGTEISGGMNRDGLTIKDGTDRATIEGTFIHDMAHDGHSPVHVDCVQIFNATNIVLRKNRFTRCSQRAIIVQTETSNGHVPARNISIYNNVFQPCNQAPCQNVDTPFQATGHWDWASNYRIVNNVIEGFAFVEASPGLVFKNNILRRFFHPETAKTICGKAYESHNLVAEFGRCTKLASTDRMGWPTFAQPRYTADPRLTPEYTTKFAFAEGSVAPPTDYYGHPRCGTTDVGADELGCG